MPVSSKHGARMIAARDLNPGRFASPAYWETKPSDAKGRRRHQSLQIDCPENRPAECSRSRSHDGAYIYLYFLRRSTAFTLSFSAPSKKSLQFDLVFFRSSVNAFILFVPTTFIIPCIFQIIRRQPVIFDSCFLSRRFRISRDKQHRRNVYHQARSHYPRHRLR